MVEATGSGAHPLINYKEVEKPLPWSGVLVEIGFGRGEFLLKLARENPHRKIVGFELSGISVEKVLKRILREGVTNVHITRIDAYWGFYLLLRDASVEKVYMNYPDPWFKRRHVKRRLTTADNLYIFARKLRHKGELRIRTDHFPFVDYTLEQAREVGCFEYRLRKLSVNEPLTKYESRWLERGKDLWELTLLRVKDPEPRAVREIKEVRMLFPVKVADRKPALDRLAGKEFTLAAGVHLRFFGLYHRGEDVLVECLLAERGFTQKFFISVRKREDHYVVDVSPFSQVLRTENLQKAVELVAHEGFT